MDAAFVHIGPKTITWFLAHCDEGTVRITLIRPSFDLSSAFFHKKINDKSEEKITLNNCFLNFKSIFTKTTVTRELIIRLSGIVLRLRIVQPM